MVTFTGESYRGNVPQLFIKSGILTGDDGDIHAATDTVLEGSHGSFALSYNGSSTECIAWDESDDLVRSILASHVHEEKIGRKEAH